MRANERKMEIMELRKNRDLDRKLAKQDEKQNRKGGVMEIEF